MLFALFAAAVVALSEGILYIIWEGRRKERRERERRVLRFGERRVVKREAVEKGQDKKDSKDDAEESKQNMEVEVEGRTTAKKERKSGLRERGRAALTDRST